MLKPGHRTATPPIIVSPLMFDRLQALAAQGDETARRALSQVIPWERIPTDEKVQD